MTKFIFRLIVFAIIGIIPLCGMELYGTSYLHRLNHYAIEPYADIMKQGPTQRGVNTLIMGTSRAWVQYNPTVIDSVLHTNSYNMGCDGRYIETSMLKWSLWVKYNRLPELIIYDVGPFGMALEDECGFEREQFYPYMFIDTTIRQFVYKRHFCRTLDKYIIGIRYLGIRGFKTNNWNEPYSLDGFNEKHLHWNSYRMERIQNFDYTKNDTALFIFNQFLSQCEELNIPVVLVLSPFYMQGQAKIGNIGEMKAMYATIASAHNMPLLDYTNAAICYDTAMFYNASHLNWKGAHQFSKQLAHDIDSLGLYSVE